MYTVYGESTGEGRAWIKKIEFESIEEAIKYTTRHESGFGTYSSISKDRLYLLIERIKSGKKEETRLESNKES